MLKRLFVALILFISSVGVWMPSTRVVADTLACTFVISPNTLYTSQGNNVQTLITNSGDTNIAWIGLFTPSANYVFNNVALADWNVSFEGGAAYLQGNSLATGNSLTIISNVQTGSDESGLDNWHIEIADNSQGLNSVTCPLSGDNQTQIVVKVGPIISNITISNITNSSATIGWETDEPSKDNVNYGKTSNYGSTTTQEANYSRAHTVTLSGLSPNTAYHFQISSTGQEDLTTTSGDNTFVTSNVPSTPTSNTSTTKIITVPDSTEKESEPPAISLQTVFDKPVAQAPMIQGMATDNVGVAIIEYSTDGGQNWLPVDTADALGGKSVLFGFTPENLDDGNYSIVARAIDFSANQTSSEPKTLVIDRLPPQVGGNVITLGPQLLQPDANGVVRVLAGVDQKITTSAIGGAIDVTLEATLSGSTEVVQQFHLTQTTDSGLWSGVLSFQAPGTYVLTATSLDGATKTTRRTIQTIEATPAAKVVSTDNEAIENATATLYYREPDTQGWVVWDGEAYGQHNPQTTKADGAVQLFIPSGTYYLKVTAAGKQTLTSTIFEIKQSLPLITTLQLQSAQQLKLGPLRLEWPNFSTDDLKISPSLTSSTTTSSIIGKPFPNFRLVDTNGTVHTVLDLAGKRSVVTILSSWAPTTSEQLPILSELQTNPDIGVLPVFAQDSTGKIRGYLQTAGSTLIAAADPDGTLVDRLNISGLPTHYVIDREGGIKKVMVGVLSKDEIMKQLVGN